MAIDLEIFIEMSDLKSIVLGASEAYATHPETEIGLDTSKYDGATYYFETVATNTGASTHGLVNSNAEVEATVSFAGADATPRRARSAAFTPNNTYASKRMARSTASGTGVLYDSRIVIVQASATKTSLQIAIGSNASGKYTAYANPSNWGDAVRKAWYFDSSVFSVIGPLEAYMEAILVSNNATAVAYACVKAWGETTAIREASVTGTTIARSTSGLFGLTSGVAYEGDFKSSASNRTATVYAVRIILTTNLWVDNTVEDTYEELGGGVPAQRSAQKQWNFTGTITSATVKVRKNNSPTGTLYARIRAISDDSIIASSPTEYDVSLFTTSYVAKTFTFSQTLSAQSVYISFEYNGGNVNNWIQIRVGQTAPMSPGVYANYKSGAWGEVTAWDLTLTLAITESITFSKVETYERCGWEQTGAVQCDENRILWTENFTGAPQVFFESTGSETATDADNDIDLRDDGTNDTGVTVDSSVANSPVNFNSTTAVRLRSSAIALTAGNRHYAKGLEADSFWGNAWIIIQTIVGTTTNKSLTEGFTLGDPATVTRIAGFITTNTSITDGYSLYDAVITAIRPFYRYFTDAFSLRDLLTIPSRVTMWLTDGFSLYDYFRHYYRMKTMFLTEGFYLWEKYPFHSKATGKRSLIAGTSATYGPSSSAVTYMSLAGGNNTGGWLTSDTNLCQYMPFACTLRKLRVRLNQAPGADQAWTFTLMKNGAATSLAVTIGGNAVFGYNNAVEVSLAADDYVTLRCSAGGAAAAPDGVDWCVECISSEGKVPLLYVLTSTNLFSTSHENFLPIISGQGNFGTNDARPNLYIQPMPCAGVITTMKLRLAAAPGAGKSWNFRVYLNGVASAVQVTIADADTTGSWSGSVSVSAGDDVQVWAIPAGTPAQPGAGTNLCFTFIPTTATDFPMMASQLANNNTGIGVYGAMGSNFLAYLREVVSEDFTVKSIYACTEYTFDGADYTTFDLLKNDVSQDTVTITGGNRKANKTGLSISIAAGDYLLCDLTTNKIYPNGDPGGCMIGFAICGTLAEDTGYYTEYLQRYRTLATEGLSLYDLATLTKIAGPIINDKSLTDYFSLGDPLSSQKLRNRYYTDALSLGDLSAFTRRRYSTISTDGLTHGEILSKYLTRKYAPTEAFTHGETFIPQKFLYRGYTDGSALADPLSSSRVRAVSFVDGPTLADILLAAKTRSKSQTDAFSFGESLIPFHAFYRFHVDGLSLGDLPSLNTLRSKSLTDGYTLGDSLYPQKLLQRTIIDALVLGDAPYSQKSLWRYHIDTYNLSETLTQAIARILGITDGILLTDDGLTVNKEAGFHTYDRFFYDYLSLSDPIVFQKYLYRYYGDGHNLGDAPSLLKSRVKSLSDGFGLWDALNFQKSLKRYYVDGLNLGDTLTFQKSQKQYYTDGYSLGDPPTFQKFLRRYYIDGYNFGDPVILTRTKPTLITDGFTFADALSSFTNRFETLTEGYLLGDPLLKALNKYQSLSDAFNLGDPYFLWRGRAKAFSDALNFGDPVYFQKALGRYYTDAYDYSDVPTKTKDQYMTIGDALTLADTISRQGTKSLLFVDGVLHWDWYEPPTFRWIDYYGTLRDWANLHSEAALQVPQGLSLSDYYSLTEDFSKNIIRNIPLSDAFDLYSLATLDYHPGMNVFDRYFTDAFNLTDQPSYQKTLHRYYTEAFNLGDAPDIVRILTRDFVDALNFHDEAFEQKIMAKLLTDGFTLYSLAIQQRNFNKLLAEYLQLTDTLSLLKFKQLNLTDASTLADVPYGQKTINRLLTEGYNFYTAPSFQRAIVLNFIDGFNIYDEHTRSAKYQRFYQDSLQLSESLNLQRQTALLISEALSLWDGGLTLQKISGFITTDLNFTDAYTLSDQLSKRLERLINLLSAFEFGEATQSQKLLGKVLLDAFSIHEELTIAMSKSKILTEAYSLHSSLLKAIQRAMQIIDDLTLADSLARQLIENKELTEAYILADQLSETMDRRVSLTEALYLSDLVTQVHGLYKQITDAATLADSLNLTLAKSKDFTEAFSFYDSLGFSQAEARQLTDAYYAADLLQFQKDLRRYHIDALSLTDDFSLQRTRTQYLSDAFEFYSGVTLRGAGLLLYLTDAYLIGETLGKSLSRSVSLIDPYSLYDDFLTGRMRFLPITDAFVLADPVLRMNQYYKILQDNLTLYSDPESQRSFNRILADNYLFYSAVTANKAAIINNLYLLDAFYHGELSWSPLLAIIRGPIVTRRYKDIAQYLNWVRLSRLPDKDVADPTWDES